jgi:hypothetical protein
MIQQHVKTKKISCKDAFEDCFLRHKYLKRVKVKPTTKELEPYYGVATHMAKNTYYNYKGLFTNIGFDLDDLIAISKAHLISFLGLFALKNLPDKFEDFVLIHHQKHKEKPSEEHFLNKNRANCTLFLKQRMEDLVRICRQKVRNITGVPGEECFYYSSKNLPPVIHADLIKNYEKLGFRKLDVATYRSVKKRSNSEYSSRIFQYNDIYYVAVPVGKRHLGAEDLIGADLDCRDNPHNFDPEKALLTSLDDKKWAKRKEKFDGSTKHVKVRTLKKFIQNNAGNVAFKQEVRTARKMLKNIGV